MFALPSVFALILSVGAAWHARGRAYATFLAVLLGLHTALSIPLFGYAQAFHPAAAWAFAYLQAATYLHFTLLAWPRLRSRPYRVLVSGPAAFFVASVMLGLPWSLAAAFGARLPAAWLPFLLGAAGLLQSLFTRTESVDLVLDGQQAGPLSRHPRAALETTETAARPLRIVQITDPHLGPFMSPQRLHRICQRAVDSEPDLIVLTGDFLTMESQHSPDPLSYALAPLRARSGSVYACLGNHDHEALELVQQALASANVTLLVDDAVSVDTPAGRVQLVGADFHWRGRRAQLSSLSERFPREPEALRLWLLHDPGAFHRIPEGEADLVLSGHTHGGHLGLLSLGLPHTIVSATTRMPDHGLWSRGPDRLYVHRGTGHYGFPLRLGVPAEESLLRIHRQARRDR